MTENRKLPWVEKYRPKSLDDVVYQDEVVKTLKKSIKTGNLPHLLFYGPPGTGKTSTILAIAKQLFSPEIFKKRFMELNASDERGINVVRTKIRNFSQVAVSTNESTVFQGKTYPCPPYKILVLDEADSMTGDAQAALRRTLEDFSHVTRFCLICNYISRIIEPLTSRCAKFRFKPLEESTVVTRLKFIAKSEKVQCEDQVFDTLVKVSDGDLRKAITYLQSAHLFYQEKLTSRCILEIAGVVPNDTIDRLFVACRSNSFESLQPMVSNIIEDGYSAVQILGQVHDRVIVSQDLNSKQKARVIEAIAKADKCLIDGADEYLQLLVTVSFMMNEMHK